MRITAGEPGYRSGLEAKGEGSTHSQELVQASNSKIGERWGGSRPVQKPRHVFRAWGEIAGRVHAAKFYALLLDFDGTLVALKRRPMDVRLSAGARRILKRLAQRRNIFVAIVSGRDLPGLRAVAGVQGVRYFGSHGGQREDRPTVLSERGSYALLRARCEVRKRLAALTGIWIEDKGLSLAIHYRGAGLKTVQAAGKVMRRILVPLRDALCLMEGLKVWEILPRELPGKGAAVQGLMGRLPKGALAIYIGDDDTDESAFAALPHEITVRVGIEKGTHANYYLGGPADVLRFLSRFERELG